MPIAAFGGAAQSVLGSDSYSIQFTAVWSAAKPLGGDETHVEPDAGK